MIKSLDVFLQERNIGQINLLPGESTFFTFEEDYIKNSFRPILSQSFISKTGQIISQTKPTRIRLHPFFSNLLPEGHLREYLAAKNQVKPEREFSLIEALGADLPGAVIIQPSEGEPSRVELTSTPEEVPPERTPYRFSLAGIQLKFSALLEKKGGLTIPASGIGGNWIVKLPSANFFQVPENEYAMLTLAKQIGIDVPECRLVSLEEIEGLPDLGPLQGHLALAVKRFDRGPNQTRIHMEDFAQVYGLYPEQKYDKVSYMNIANMIWTLCGEKGLTEYIRRLVFSVLIGNGDMHLKNWSFLYPDGRTPLLSPAYDLLSTVPYIPGDNLALTLVKTKQMHLCNEQVFNALAEKAKLPKHLVLNTMKQTVEATRQNWPQIKQNADLDQKILSAIDEHMALIPL
jgi:serine/threonine-protein kinase HipA